jgi:acetoacetyl-CoA synthetase
MTQARQEPLWIPSAQRIATARITDYHRWLHRTRGLDLPTWDALWGWSVADLDAFWSSIREYFDVRMHGSVAPALAREVMPGAQWFPDATLNYVDQVFRHAAPQHPAVIAGNESGALDEIAWHELEQRVGALAATLRARGVQQGDRVVAYLPNTADAIVAFLASASLGAIWSMCSPDMGAASVIDRFRQITPKVLIAVDGYTYGGRVFDRRAVVAQLREALPSLELTVRVPASGIAAAPGDGELAWRDALAHEAAVASVQVPFAHPLWIVYSSGTTGLPKPIVHGHGGIVLEHLRLALQNDLGSSDRFHWYSSTGWIMWNLQVGGLLAGATICIYDGSPAHPDAGAWWRFIDRVRATSVGSGAAFYAACMKQDVVPRPPGALAALRTIGSTGSPLSPEAHAWLQREMGQDVWINPISGGTDIASAFVGGVCTLPVYAGEMQARSLGSKVEAWTDAGEPVIGTVGELVCTRPMPSMPLYFWNDPGDRRYRDSYFDVFPGVWRHGDWIEITPRGGAIVYGRSDATINRNGIRMGTSELYSAVEALPEVADSLVVDLEYLGREPYMPLFVVLREGARLDDALKARIMSAVRTALTPKHVPSAIFAVAEVPRTLTGKKLEVPIKRLLLGEPLGKVCNLDAVANAGALPWFETFARTPRA